LVIRAAVGNPHLFLLRAAARGMRRARGGSGAHFLERGEASGDLHDDGIPGALGAATELAGHGAGISGELGGGLPVGGMVRGVGLGASPTGRGGIHRGGRDSLGTRLAGRQLPNGHLPDRRAPPALAVGGAAFAGHATAAAESTGAGGRPRPAVCVQRHVETLSRSHRGPGQPAFARAGSFPHHAPSQRSGGSVRRAEGTRLRAKSKPAAQAWSRPPPGSGRSASLPAPAAATPSGTPPGACPQGGTMGGTSFGPMVR